MSTTTHPADLAGVVTRAGEVLADGGHRADGDDVWAAAVRVNDEVEHQLRAGAPTVDAALNTVAQVVCDRLATRLLQGRPVGGALHDVAVLHALLGHPFPTSWFAVSVLDDVLAP